MRKATLPGILLIFATLFSNAQEAPKAEVFGGYSYLSAQFSNVFPLNKRVNLNGWNASLAVNPNRWLGIAADFSGHYGSPTFLFSPPIPPPLTVSLDTKVFTFIFGPRVSHRAGRATGFAHALFGGSHATLTANVASGQFPASLSDTGFAMAVGGGLDVRLGGRLGWRLVQADYLMTRLFDDTQNNFRLSTGIVVRF